MNPTPWSLVEPTTRIEELAPCALVVFTDHERQLVLVKSDEGTDFRWQRIDSRVESGREHGIDGQRSLAVLGEQLRWRHDDPCRFLLVPGFSIPQWPARLWGILVFASAVVTMGVTVWTQNTVLSGIGFLWTLIGPVGIACAQQHIEILGQQKVGVTDRNVHAYALAVERGELWRGEFPAGAIPTPRQQVQRIRQEHRRLRTDLVYRLENPALFDPTVPTTAAFTAAVADFDDSPSQDAANRVEVRFQIARQFAERVGTQHVPAEHRDELLQAVEVARSVAGASSEERTAALAQLQHLLDALALPHLPSRTELAVITT